MHRVLNYGSALQAFALQKKLSDLGYKSEIIDYLYPNVEHLLYHNPNGLKESNNTFKASLIPLIMYIKKVLHNEIKKIKLKKELFNTFYKENFILSSKTYATRLMLENDPPHYDIYMTGSDQVWNEKYIGYDMSFMFHFVKDSNPRIAYAASFSVDQISEKYRPYYKKELSKYRYISVREESAITIIENLINKKATLVCDPTLLLNKDDWQSLAKKSLIKLPKEYKYILVYILEYSYNPYPYILDRIQEIKSILNLPIIILSGHKEGVLKKAKSYSEYGPYEFLSLFMNASFIITTSFHGTAFALNFNKPFCSIIKNKSDSDSRIYSLLKYVGLTDSAITYNEKIYNLNTIINCNSISRIEEYRNFSINYLSTSLASLQ